MRVNRIKKWTFLLVISAVTVDGAPYRSFIPGGSDPIYNNYRRQQQQQQSYYNNQYKDYRHQHQYIPFPITLVYGAIGNPVRGHYRQ
jgi:hypothetical protein